MSWKQKYWKFILKVMQIAQKFTLTFFHLTVLCIFRRLKTAQASSMSSQEQPIIHVHQINLPSIVTSWLFPGNKYSYSYSGNIVYLTIYHRRRSWRCWSGWKVILSYTCLLVKKPYWAVLNSTRASPLISIQQQKTPTLFIKYINQRLINVL